MTATIDDPEVSRTGAGPDVNGEQGPDRSLPRAGDPTRSIPRAGTGPEASQDDIRWLIYLAIGLVAFLALVAWSGFHNAMRH